MLHKSPVKIIKIFGQLKKWHLFISIFPSIYSSYNETKKVRGVLNVWNRTEKFDICYRKGFVAQT